MNRDPELLDENFHYEFASFVMLPDRIKLGLLPREHWKTTIGTIDDSIRGSTLDPVMYKGKLHYNGESWFIAHYSREKSKEMLYEIRSALLYNETLREWYPYIAVESDDVANAEKIYLKAAGGQRKDPTFLSSSVESSNVSTHCKFMKIDDCLETEKSDSPDIQLKVDKFWRGLFALKKGRDWRMDVWGTPWVFQGLYSKLMEQYEKDQKVDAGKKQLNLKVMFKPVIYIEDGVKKTICPSIMTVEDVAEISNEHLMGAKYVSSQYLLRPLPEGDITFQPEWFKFISEEEIPGTNWNTYILVDPATSKRRDKRVHYAAIIYVMVNEFSDIIVRDYTIKQRMGSPRMADEIFRMHRLYSPGRTYIEEEFAKDLTQWMKVKSQQEHYPIIVSKFKKSQQSKESRILSRLPGFFKDGKVYFMDWMNDDVLYRQTIEYGAGLHDDGIDALSRVCQVMKAPSPTLPEAYRDLSLEAELQDEVKKIMAMQGKKHGGNHLERLVRV